MVTPAWPPTTGTSTSWTARPLASATKVLARTTSSVVTPSTLRLSYTPAAFMTSAVMGTVEFTGLEMIAITACVPKRASFTFHRHSLQATTRVLNLGRSF